MFGLNEMAREFARTEIRHSLRREPGETKSPSFVGIRFPEEIATCFSAPDCSRSAPLPKAGAKVVTNISSLGLNFLSRELPKPQG